MIRAINPATEIVLSEHKTHSLEEAKRRIAGAEQAFASWRRTAAADRGQKLANAAERLLAEKQALAELMTAEMGKPIREAVSEIEKCAVACRYYADHGEEFLAERVIATDAERSYVRFDPLGVVLAIMPWNFPYWQVFRFAAPALMAGNVAILKHAANVPGCALSIERILLEAGFPQGVFTTLLISSEEVEQLLELPAVRAVSLTGSDRAGSAVAEQAGKHLKKCVLELGGSDPFIVLADAPIKEVASQAVKARCINSGQSCIAAKRFIVENSIAEPFVEAMAERMERLEVGDPRDEQTEIGPLARADLLDALQEQVDQSVEAGARVVTGGRRLDRKGYFYAPTLIADATPDMPVFSEETFGPVAAVIRARDIDDALQLANHSQYGLGASLWTADPARAARYVGEVEAGCVFINEIVKSDPRVPFGGIKRSGFGRELADYGLREFVNIKTVWIGRENATR